MFHDPYWGPDQTWGSTGNTNLELGVALLLGLGGSALQTESVCSLEAGR